MSDRECFRACVRAAECVLAPGETAGPEPARPALRTLAALPPVPRLSRSGAASPGDAAAPVMLMSAGGPGPHQHRPARFTALLRGGNNSSPPPQPGAAAAGLEALIPATPLPSGLAGPVRLGPDKLPPTSPSAVEFATRLRPARRCFAAATTLMPAGGAAYHLVLHPPGRPRTCLPGIAVSGWPGAASLACRPGPCGPGP